MWTRLRRTIARLHVAWSRRRVDEDTAREVEAHLRLLTERYIASGLSGADADAAARRQFGNTALLREEIHQMNALPWIDGAVQDLRDALRQLRLNPAVSAVVVATLALGIGGTTAVFSVVRAVLLAPLPYEEPGRLVRFYQQEPDNPSTRYYLTGPRREIVGIVGDVALDVYGAPTLVVYHAHRQFAGNRNWALSQVVATEGAPEQALAAVRAAVANLDPDLVVHRAATMHEIVGRGVSRQRFALFLMATFAAVALVLAVLGLYSVLAYSVRQRTQEIGIRIALGASAARVRALVMRQAALVLAIGLAGGLGGAVVLGRWLSSLAFQISPWDTRILLATSSILVLAGLASAWLPARRAARVAPGIAMRAD